jgi:uncharacterized iron-regulated protein
MRNIIFLLAVWMVFLSGCAQQPKPLEHPLPADCRVYAMKSARCIDQEQLADKLAHYRVIFVGDHHRSEAVHRFIAEMIEALHRKGYRIHLANEWFTPEDNALLHRYASGTYEGNFTAAIDWKKTAGYDFSLYEPLYQSVQKIRGGLYGVNMAKAMKRRISDQNISGMGPEEKSFYDSLDLNLSAHYQMLEPFFSHCHAAKAGESEEECRERMYRVQVAWDAYMGEQSAALASELLKRPEEKLVVFVGAMHLAYGLGVNARFARMSDLPFATLLPQMLPKRSVRHCKADFIYLYEPSKKAADGPLR